MSVQYRREWGVLVERAIASELGLEHVPDDVAEWHDLTVDEDVTVIDVDGPVGVLQEDQPGEVKTTAEEICKTSTPRPGRWHLTRANHERLLLEDGFYVLTTYRASDADVAGDLDDVLEALETVLVVPAETIDYLVDSWRDSGHGYEYTQLSWTSVLQNVDAATSNSLKSPQGDTEDRTAATGRESNAVERPPLGRTGRSTAGDNHE